jgi:hypothetical protein
MRESETNQIYSEITNIHEEEEQTISTVQKIMDSVNERINNLYTEHEKIHSLFSRLHATFLENTTDFETTFTEFLNVVRSFENEFTIFKQEFENNISGAWQSLKNDKNLSAFMEKSYKQLADMKSSLEKELMQAKIVQEQVRQQILITNRTLQVIADKEALISQNKPIPAQWAVDQNTIRKIISVDLYRVMEIFKNNNFEDMEFTNLVRQEINHLEKEFDLQAPQQITPSVQMAS